MNISAIVTAVVVVGGVGLFLGIFLGIASIVFKVAVEPERPVISLMEEMPDGSSAAHD